MSDQPTPPDKQKETPPAEVKPVDTPDPATPPAAPTPTTPTNTAPSQPEEPKTWVVDLPPIDNLYNFGMAQSDRDRLIAQQLLFSQFLRDHVKEMVGVTALRILDLGCADGQVTRVFSEIFPQAQIVGADKDPSAIEKAKKNQANFDSFMEKPIEFVVAEAEGPLPDGPFDLVYSSLTLMYAPNTEKALREIFRVLRPGGYVWIKDLDQRFMNGIENNSNFTRLEVLLNASFMKIGIKTFLAMDLFSLLPQAGFLEPKRLDEYYPINNATMHGKIAASILVGGLFNAAPVISKMQGIPAEDVKKMVQDLAKDINNVRGGLALVNVIAQKPR